MYKFCTMDNSIEMPSFRQQRALLTIVKDVPILFFAMRCHKNLNRILIGTIIIYDGSNVLICGQLQKPLFTGEPFLK